VYYYVIGADGGRYGPADIDTLVRWALEGRIIASTTLIDRGTEQSIPAESITAVAAAIRRVASGAAAVAIERDTSSPGEAATVTRMPSPGEPAAGRFQQPSPLIPPVPPVPPMPPYGGQAYGQPLPMPYVPLPANVSPKSKIVAGLLGIFLGWLGIHRFYLGYNGIGLLMLLLTIIAGPASSGCTVGLVGTWGFVEGIICLCGGMRDADGRDLRS
jgi:TM2 domain-containing membrane protein YozV